MLTFQSIKHDGQPCLRLSGVLTIYTVAQARQDIPESLAQDGIKELDLSGLEELDTAGVQLLLWLKRDSASRGVGLALTRHSPAAIEVIEQLRVASVLGDPLVLAPSAT